MADDYADWPTKQQAATLIGVSTKAIERFTRANKLEQRFRPQAGSPDVAVYHPDDVARLAAARRPAASAFVLPAGKEPPRNGNGHHALQTAVREPAAPAVQPPGDDPLRALFAAALRAVVSQTSQTSALFLTLSQAEAESGLPRKVLRQFIAEGKLVPVCGRSSRSWRVRRRDLEAL